MAMLQNQIVKESPIYHNKNHVTCKTTGVFPLSKKRLETREMTIDKAVSRESYLCLPLQHPNHHNVLLRLVVVQVQLNSYYQDYFFFFWIRYVSFEEYIHAKLAIQPLTFYD